MSQSELDSLAAEEAELHTAEEELQAKMRVLKLKQQEARNKEDAKRPVSILVSRLSGGSLLIESDFREDVVALFKTIPGRMFKGYITDYTLAYSEQQKQKRGKNLIPIKEWGWVEERLEEEFHEVTVTWNTGLKEEVEWYLNAPPWDIVVHPSRRHFLCKSGPGVASHYVMSSIAGADFDSMSKSWKIPFSEGWRIPKTLHDVEGVVYSEDAQKVIFKQVEDRAVLDELVNKGDTDFTARLTRLVKVRGKEELVPFHEAMMPFQRITVEFHHKSGGKVLVGHDTGLGKTWIAVASAEIRRMDKNKYTTLIIAKAANIPNWARELKNLTGEDVLILKGGKPDYFMIQSILGRNPYSIISYDTLGSGSKPDPPEDLGFVKGSYEWKEWVKRAETDFPWVNVFKTADVDFLVMDEAHQIKSPDALRSKATRKLFDIVHTMPMTASPVLGRTEELWPLLFMVDPEMFKVHDQFISHYTVNGKYARNAKDLHELMRPIFIRYRKKDVMKDLPPINRINRLHALSKDSAERYEEILQGLYREIAEYDPQGFGGQEMSIISILAKITRLKQVCAADMVEHTADLALELIEEHSNGNGCGKVLVFSQFKGTSFAIAERLGEGVVCTVKRTPTDFVSMDAVERDNVFEGARNNDQIKFLVTTEAAKEGHNLEFCDWVIFNDPLWTPAGHMQCEGRAYGRLSNPHPIDSFYMMSDVEIIKWIFNLLDNKMGIIDESVEGIERSRDNERSMQGELMAKIKESMWVRGK